jgi:hypothetical protein
MSSQTAHRQAGSGTRRRRTGRLIILVLVCVWIVVSVRSAAAGPQDTFDLALNGVLSGKGFDIVAWEIGALGTKAYANLVYSSPTLAGLEGSQTVRAYMELSGRAQQLRDRLEEARARQPAGAPPGDDIVAGEKALAALRAQQRAMQTEVETIIERQVARVAEREGLTTAGVVFPPVLFRFYPLPLHLVISPRNRIELQETRDLRADLTLSERERIEAQIDRSLNVSSLVEDIGGYGAYPPLVMEDASLEWLVSTVAHEWTHNYMVFRRLGWAPETAGMTTIQETVASIVGDEIGARVIEQYYPWIEPPALSWQTPRPIEAQPTPEPERAGEFSFGKFMRATRLEADRLLAAGDISGAEAYMEQRRQELVRRGYYIRKLNQAYFAFHGLYATGAGATDPIGPKLEALRRRTPSLAAFVSIVSRFTSPQDLEDALKQWPEPRP